jgi:hypothetical protein
MRPILVVSLLLIAAGTGWAGEKSRTKGAASADSGKDKETPASFNKTFQWEEKVVGPKDKGVDHQKIAAMQEQARREDAEKRRQDAAGTGRSKKPSRAEGVAAPATATLPTMDIEKAPPARSPVRKAAYVQPKQHDALDNLLAENGVGSGDDASGRDGLGKVLGTSGSSHRAKHAKHARHRH